MLSLLHGAEFSCLNNLRFNTNYPRFKEPFVEQTDLLYLSFPRLSSNLRK